ncbi:hypothetical protein PsorP6_008135 [Peronosclerospora sorghi]|uniref:Uncharacterized protein n=1 Tax=Peronosclerospora sorghi TaxID=230839 RepID=A0ACC0W9Z5_9STRA|nr:hypothetical protein PsorP6_008135 [Peronosclerospora sorghi]
MLGKVQPQVKHNADKNLRKQFEDLQDALVRVTAEREAYRADTLRNTIQRDTYCQADLSTVRIVLAYDELKQTNKLHSGDVASVGEEADPARVETEAVDTRVEKEADGACGEEETYIAGVESASAEVARVESAYKLVDKAAGESADEMTDEMTDEAAGKAADELADKAAGESAGKLVGE